MKRDWWFSLAFFRLVTERLSVWYCFEEEEEKGKNERKRKIRSWMVWEDYSPSFFNFCCIPFSPHRVDLLFSILFVFCLSILSPSILSTNLIS